MFDAQDSGVASQNIKGIDKVGSVGMRYVQSKQEVDATIAITLASVIAYR